MPPRTGALKGRREQRRWSGRPGEQGHALSSVPMGGSGLHGSLEMGGERSQVLWAQHGRAEGRGLRPVPVGRAEQGGAAHSDRHPWKAALAKRRTAGHAGEAGGPVLSVQISRGAQLGHHSSPRSLGHGELVSDSLRPHESHHARPPCPSPTPGVHPDSRPSSH